MHEIDQRLRDDGARWRADGAMTRSRRSRQHRRPLLIAAAAGTVAALVVAIVITIRVGDGSPHASATAANSTAASSHPPLPMSPASADTMTPGTLPPGAILSPLPPLSATQTAGAESVPWKLILTTDDADGLNIVYYIGSSSCERALGLRLIETAASVELLIAINAVPLQESCTADAVYGFARIALAGPIGSRSLLHAPTDIKASLPY